jgi:cysteinyl-tRNA synthetase
MSTHLNKMREELAKLDKFCKHSNGISLKDYKEISSQIAKISTQLNQHQYEMYSAVTNQMNTNNTIEFLIETMVSESMTHAEKTGVSKAIRRCINNLSLPVISHPPSCKANFNDDIPF